MKAELRDVAVTEIVTAELYRRRLGDLTGLRESIRRAGLLHPLVVTPQMRLISGSRRLAAFAQLGHQRVKVLVITELEDAVNILVAERNESLCRLDMLPSEKAALGRRLEGLHRVHKPGASHRAGEGGGSSRYEAKEQIGDALGMSGTTYNQLKRVYNATGDEPSAVAALRRIDETGKIRGVADQWAREHPQVRHRPVAVDAEVSSRPRSSRTVEIQHPGVKRIISPARQLALIEQASHALGGVADGLGGVLPLSEGIDTEKVHQWHVSMRKSLTRISRALREMESHQ